MPWDTSGCPTVAGRRLVFLFSAARPTAPCQRKNVLLVSRMGSGHRGFIPSPAADFLQSRTRPRISRCPCVCWRGQIRERGMLNLPAMESRGAAQSTLLSQIIIQGFSLFCQLMAHPGAETGFWECINHTQ